MSDSTVPGEVPSDLERRLATILCADVAGYSRMMGENEDRTVRVFRGHREIFESLVKQHRGRIFNTAGDALLAEFSSAVEAVRCATDIQAALRTRNEHLAAEERMLFRIGINLGDVIVQGGDLLGDGVNVAARIQAATEPGGICISGSVHEQIQNKLSLDFKLLGEQTYKNIAKPVRTYTINEGAAVTSPARRATPKLPAAIALAVAAVAGAGWWGYSQFEAQRAERVQLEARLAEQLAVQKQATEQALRAAEDAKREAQAQAQRQAADEAMRRAQDERSRLEQDRKQLENDKRVAEAAKKQAADDALRRAQDERERLERERRQLEGEKLAAEAARKQATSRPQAPAAAKSMDGTYSGRFCNQYESKAPSCWSVALIVRDGSVEGNWLGRAQQPEKAVGTVANDGTLQLKLDSHSSDGKRTEALLAGRFSGDSITASGQWRNGPQVTGEWKRAQSGPASTARSASQDATRHDGTWSGQLCNRPRDGAPNCWRVVLAVRNGRMEADWLTRTQNKSTASGTISADGAVKMLLQGWNREGNPVGGEVSGRVADNSINVAGKWSNGGVVDGSWKRAP